MVMMIIIVVIIITIIIIYKSIICKNISNKCIFLIKKTIVHSLHYEVFIILCNLYLLNINNI